MGEVLESPALPAPALPASRGRLRGLALTLLAAMTGSAIAIAAAAGIWYGLQPSSDELPGKLIDSMNQFLQNNQQLRQTGIHVTAVTVMHASENIYQAEATVADGTVNHQVPVHVTYDGQTVLWNTDSGAFLFAFTHADP